MDLVTFGLLLTLLLVLCYLVWGFIYYKVTCALRCSGTKCCGGTCC